MPAALRKIHPGLDLDKAQEHVRCALRLAYHLVGSQKAFRDKLNAWLREHGYREIGAASISYWLAVGQLLDQRYWVPIEEMTDMAVTRRHLRPDKYGFVPIEPVPTE